jgi:ATP-dependent phosphoenolpyruvate carboxykinase
VESCYAKCRNDRIENAAQVFDEIRIRVVLENARVLLLSKAPRVQNAVGRMLRRCADASAWVEQHVRGRAEQRAAKARQSRSERVTNNGRRRKKNNHAGRRRVER